jgi:hypothetical protein
MHVLVEEFAARDLMSTLVSKNGGGINEANSRIRSG